MRRVIGRGHIRWIVMGLLALGVTSCKVKRPDTVLPDEKMEAVLYDYHIAKAMGEQVPYDESYKRVLYIQSVYRKHGITEAQFDSSMVWFSRNPKSLSDIYVKVNERLKAAKEKIDGLVALRDNRPKTSKAGDSIDVWAWQRTYRLTGMPLSNRILFTLPSDSNFHDRDTLRWSIRFRYEGGVTPDTTHTPVMAMQVYYEGDSIRHHLLRILTPGVHTVSVWSDSLGGIKEVNGFVYYPQQDVAGRVLLADEVTLMRYHARGDSTVTRPRPATKGEMPRVSAPLPKQE